MTRLQTNCLAVAPETVSFGNGDIESMQAYLKAQHDCTRTVQIASPGAALLDADGLIRGRYRLSTTALKQLCSKLVPGLSQYVAGITDGYSADNIGTAVDVINQTITLRFTDKLDGCQFVINEQSGVIDGMVGRRYEYLSNHDLFKRCTDFIRLKKLDLTFDCGALTGRRFMTQFRKSAPTFEITTPKVNEPFFSGFHFSNSEVGECAVRAATILIRQICDNGAMGSVVEGGRLVHIKQDKFDLRFQKLLDSVQKKAAQYTTLKDGIMKLMATNLGLGKDRESHAERVAYILKKLRKHQIRTTLAKRAVSRVLLCSSYDMTPLSMASPATTADYRSRTEFDLFNAITFEAKHLSVMQQEIAQRIAHKMVTGHISFHS